MCCSSVATRRGDAPSCRRSHPSLWDRHSELRLFRFTEPVHGGIPGLVFGADKYRLLARARILVNVHRDDEQPGYFEWARIVEAMANGTTVVTEPSTGFEPLQPGVHFVESDDIAGSVAELLDDRERCAAIGKAGSNAVLDEHPLSRRITQVLERLDGLDVTPRGARRRRVVRRNRPMRAPKPPLLPPFRPADALRRPGVRGARRRTSPAAIDRVVALPAALRLRQPHARVHDARVRQRHRSGHGQRRRHAAQLRRCRDRSARLGRRLDRHRFRDRRRRRSLHRRRPRRRAAVHGRPRRRPDAAARP